MWLDGKYTFEFLNIRILKFIGFVSFRKLEHTGKNTLMNIEGNK